MWGGLGDRLASLGDTLTNTASAHAKRQHEEQAPPVGDNEGAGSAAAAATPDKDCESTATEATEESSGDAAASDQQPLPKWATSLASTVSDRQTWSKWGRQIQDSTRQIVEETKITLEKEQLRIQANAPSLFAGQGGPYRRDVSLPLDVEALRDAEVVYVTDRIVTMSHPHMQSTDDGDVTADRKLAAVSHLLRKRHGGRYMVWNLSEVEYDSSVLDDQVLVYKFPGSPSPPLGLLLKLLMSVESWLRADPRNVAVLHCLTGRGRTSTVLAAFLCWTGEAGFNDVNSALGYIARCKRLPVASLTIPSQVRYAGYFANMLDGVRPSQPPLLLKRIIMSSAPRFGKRAPPPAADGGDGAAGPGEAVAGCAPYIQIFKAGTLVFTTAASVNYAQAKDDLPFCPSADGPVSFVTESVVQGDILLRCRHLTKSGQRVSMFRCAFHTGYVPPKVLRLTRAQLDGACGDRRFDDGFFLDLIFEACDGATASRHLAEKAGDKPADGGGDGTDEPANEAAERRSMGTVGREGGAVSASAYDTMLHRDSRFWDVISRRREENMRRQAELEKAGGGGAADGEKKAGDDGGGSDGAENTSLSGPTIGRRRDFAAKQPAAGPSGDGDKPNAAAGGSKAKAKGDRLSAFSIGEEFGLGSSGAGLLPKGAGAAPVSPRPKEKDALLEALDDLDFDDDGLLDDDDEIVFDDDDEEEGQVDAGEGVRPPTPPTEPAPPATEEGTASEPAAEAHETDAASEPTAPPAEEGDAAAPEVQEPDAAAPAVEDARVDQPDAPVATAPPPEEEAADAAGEASDVLEGLGDELADLDIDGDVLGDGDGGGEEDGGGDYDDFDFDAEDEDLADLESFLTKSLS